MNRLIVAWKRILHRKLYWCMLGVLLILTGIYALLPAKSQSTEIRVAVYLEDTSAYTTQFKEELDASASLYQFYYVDASTDVIRDVQAGDAECGFVLPDGFFSGYIAGSGEPKVSLYETSASTLSSAICETFFHYIFKVASPQILVDTIDDAALSEDLKSRMQTYMDSDTIFRMSSVTDGAYDYKENTYRIQLPIFECTCLLILFASLFSLMLFLQDQERGIYIALSGKRRYGILCTGDGEVIFKKYSPMGELSGVTAQYVDVLSKCFALTAFVSDRDRILAASGAGRRDLADRSVSQPLEKLMDSRKPYQSDGSPEKALLPCEGSPRVLLCAVPIIAAGDVTGSVGLLTEDRTAQPDAAQLKAVNVAAAFLAKQMEE